MLKHTTIFAVIAALVFALAPAAQVSAALVGWWNLDDGSGSTAADSSPNPAGGSANDGSLSGTTTWNTGLTGATDSITMPHGLEFAGASVSLTADRADFYPLTKGTISAWFRRDTAASGNDTCIIGTAGGNYMRLQIENGNNVRVRTSNATTTYEASASFTNDGNWHHLAFTSSTNVSAPGISKVYYDGVLTTMSRDDLPFIVAYADNTAFTIGSRGGSHPWDGTLGDIRIYDEVLDQKAIDYISTAANYGDGRIPEPATMMLLGIGGLGLVIRGRRRA